jgi:hypothetical protein
MDESWTEAACVSCHHSLPWGHMTRLSPCDCFMCSDCLLKKLACRGTSEMTCHCGTLTWQYKQWVPRNTRKPKHTIDPRQCHLVSTEIIWSLSAEAEETRETTWIDKNTHPLYHFIKDDLMSLPFDQMAFRIGKILPVTTSQWFLKIHNEDESVEVTRRNFSAIDLFGEMSTSITNQKEVIDVFRCFHSALVTHALKKLSLCATHFLQNWTHFLQGYGRV